MHRFSKTLPSIFRGLRSNRNINNSRRNHPTIQRLSCMSTLSSNEGPMLAPLDTFSEEEKLIQETAAKVAREQIRPMVKSMEANGELDQGIVKQLFQSGLLSVQVPVEYGGSGASFTASTIAVHEISKEDVSLGVITQVANHLTTPYLIALGNEEQKAKYLPRMCIDAVSSFCLSEPGSGSDAFAMKTTAQRQGDYFILNGSKMWISNSDLADIFIVMANADPSQGYRGITCFILERDMPGFTVGKKIDKLGIKASGTCPLYFDNVKVPVENVLGEVGKGYIYCSSRLNEGRIGVAAQLTGVAEGCLNKTLPYLLDRQQFGKRIWDFQSMKHNVAKLRTEIEASKLLLYNASRKQDLEQPCIKESAMAKYYASEVAATVTAKCIEMMGGVGFTEDFPQEKYYRDCIVGKIVEGSSAIQLETIAKFMEREEMNF